jgi:hypothetical protein
MISSEQAAIYDEPTERTENLLKYIIEPAIKKAAMNGKRSVKLLMFDTFINLTFIEQIFCTDKTLIAKYLHVFDYCYRKELMFVGNNKSIIQYRLSTILSSLGYHVLFNDVQNDKICEGFSIVITW